MKARMIRRTLHFTCLTYIHIVAFQCPLSGFSQSAQQLAVSNNGNDDAPSPITSLRPKINVKVRSILAVLQERYPDSDHAQWTKLRNYLYKTDQQLTLAQIRNVVDFLNETFPDNPELQPSLLQSSPRILRKNVNTSLRPTVQFLRNLYGDLFLEAVKRNPDLLLTRGTGYNADTLDMVRVYLSHDLELSSSAIDKLKRSSPFLFQLPMHKVLSVVAFLRQQLLTEGSDEDQINKTIAKIVTTHPSILQLSVEQNLQPSLEFLETACGLQTEDLAALVQSCSIAVLGLSVNDNLKPTIDFLKNIVSDQTDIRKILLSHPQLLGLSLNNLSNKVAYFDSIDPHPSKLAARILLRAPAVFSLSLVDNIQPKVAFLASVWGCAAPTEGGEHSNSDLALLLSEYPSILTLSLEGNLRPTVNFFNRTGYIQLDENWKGQARLLRGRYMAGSLFHRLLPRWHYHLLLAQNTTTTTLPAPPLHLLVSASDSEFCRQMQFNANDYNEFCKEAIPRLKFSSQFDTWLKTGRPIQ